jgi:hypothetical protein
MLLMARGPRAAHAQGAPGSPARSTVLLVDDDDVVYRPQTERVLFPMQRSAGQVRLMAMWARATLPFRQF